MEDMKAEWTELHNRLGCPKCLYCDEKALYIGACCTFYHMPKVDADTGKCLTRKEKTTNEVESDSTG